MTEIRIENLSFEIQDKVILDNISLTIDDGEYVTLVGPTGAGKTSLIKIIAGLIKPSSGKIFFDGIEVTNIPPEERNCGVMFESYALFPHLNILDNISYARHMKESDHQDTYVMSREVIDLVRLSNRDSAFPYECSGGMKQRVALARAIMALEKRGILILDEPFKSLDAGLRMNLRIEVKKIAKSPLLHMTTIHVTNDMQEAMMGERIIVLHQGKIRQFDTPNEIMYNPQDLFIANFFSTEINHFSGKILSKSPAEGTYFKDKTFSKISVKTEENYILYAKTEKDFEVGDEVTFLIRSQYFKARHKKRETKTNSIYGKIKRVKFMGAWLRIELISPYKPENWSVEYMLTENNNKSSPKKTLKIEVPTTRTAIHNFVVNEAITAYFPSEFVIVFPRISNKELEETLRIN
ncbi:MAG: ABC transporter ATP-binding protein [Candidatus Lokiarchaeota archaeon]|nr:ABC transporter ATP-binding protein [Candidatus Lokiarchaeota archaeon]